MGNRCKRGYNVEVLRSNAGYYIGTLDEEGFPNCRLSEEYYKTSEKAEKALENRMFTERESEEIMFCNGTTRYCVI